MWWRIAGIVSALDLFACWIAWELYHAPMIDDMLAIFTLDDDEEEEEEDESEDAGSSQ